MDFVAIDEFLSQEGIVFRFAEFIGDGQLSGQKTDTIINYVVILIKKAIQAQKEQFITLLILCILFGLVSQISIAFENKNFEEYGFYLYFIACASICIRMFAQGYDMVVHYMNTILSFVKMLAPTYCMSVVFSNGPQTAAGYYGMILGAVVLLQYVMITILLPGIKIVMAIELANAGTGQAMLSKLCQLLYDGVGIGLKVMMGIVCGWHFVQGLILSNADAVGQELYKTFSFLPGIGQISLASVKLIMGTALVIKNSIGAAGLIALGLLMVKPLATLGCYLIGFRLIEAFMQPLVQDRLLELFRGCGQCILLLLKSVTHTFALLFLSLSILTTLS